MGNAISTNSPVGVLSFISILIGFITFLSSLLTTLNVFWQSLTTATQAPSQVNSFLGGLGVSLREELLILRRLKRRARQRARTGEGGGPSTSRSARRRDALEDEAVWRQMEHAVKGMCTRWAELEKPFRQPHSWDDPSDRKHRRRGHNGVDDDDNSDHSPDDGDASPPPHPYTHRRGSGRVPAGVYRAREEARRARDGRGDAPPPAYRYDSDREKHAGDWGGEDPQHKHHLSRTTELTMEIELMEGRRYVKRMGFGLRWLWVRRRPEAVRLSEGLSRAQTRRIARQTAGIALCVNRLFDAVDAVETRVEDVEARLVGPGGPGRRAPPPAPPQRRRGTSVRRVDDDDDD